MDQNLTISVGVNLSPKEHSLFDPVFNVNRTDIQIYPKKFSELKICLQPYHKSNLLFISSSKFINFRSFI